MKKQIENSRFQTHIKEPRWQQIISVLVVTLIALLWVYFSFIKK